MTKAVVLERVGKKDSVRRENGFIKAVLDFESMGGQ